MSDTDESFTDWALPTPVPNHLQPCVDYIDENREVCIWSPGYEGARSLAEVASRARALGDGLAELAALGYELRGEIVNGHGCIGKLGDDGTVRAVHLPDDFDEPADSPSRPKNRLVARRTRGRRRR